jgi:RNA-directed DNA polymerase
VKIPTGKDRVMQAIVTAALEPEWEARFEANSYGFRPGRCTMDAIEALHNTLSRHGASAWILDADIRGCFDNLAHAPLLAKLPVFTTTLRRWLKAGVVELGFFAPTDTGTPQGGGATPPTRVSGSTETKTYGKDAAGREHEEKRTLPRISLFGKDVDEM